MKKGFIFLGIFAVSTSVFGVTLKNKDSQSYDIKVISSSSSMSSSISGGTTKPGICSSCEIEVKGVGSIEASGSETVVIEGGQLSK